MAERPDFAPYTPGRRAYLAYAATTGHLTHDGRDMPHWDGLTEIIRDAWEAAATANELADEHGHAPVDPLFSPVFNAIGEILAEADRFVPLSIRKRLTTRAINTVRQELPNTPSGRATRELAELGNVLLHLDRCAHGRHHGDDCGTGMYNSTSCSGTSMGNPHMPPGTVIGYHLRGRIVVPEHADRDKPEAWLRRETYDPRCEPGSTVAPLVKGKCPACGGHTLFLADGGHITCMRNLCPNPTQLNDQINQDTE